jgi:hypothetical protein
VYKDDFSFYGALQDNNLLNPDENGVYTSEIPEGVKYVRFSVGEFSEETIITINEEIV